MPHGTTRDVVQRQRFLVVAQPIRRRTTESPQRGVDTGDYRRQRLIANRQDDAEATPRQPGAPQPCFAIFDQGPIRVIPLEPQPWFRQPRSKSTSVASRVVRLGL